MVREQLKGSASKGEKPDKMVKLHVTGAMLKRSFVARASVRETWAHFLGRRGLRFIPQDGIYPRTIQAEVGNRNTRSNGSAAGWRAELGDKIEDFVNKFSVKRTEYTVRLARTRRPKMAALRYPPDKGSRRRLPQPLPSFKNDAAVEEGAPEKKVYRRISRPATPVTTPAVKTEDTNLYQRPRYTPGLTAGNVSQQSCYGTRTRRVRDSLFHAEMDADAYNGRCLRPRGRSNDTKMFSTPQQRWRFPSPPQLAITSSSQTVRELDLPPRAPNGRFLKTKQLDSDPPEVKREVVQQNGAKAEAEGRRLEQEDDNTDDDGDEEAGAELKPFGVKIIDRMSNSFLLMVRQEIQRLKERNLWERSVMRCPRSCYLLEKIVGLRT